jgi:hypothetical protein
MAWRIRYTEWIPNGSFPRAKARSGPSRPFGRFAWSKLVPNRVSARLSLAAVLTDVNPLAESSDGSRIYFPVAIDQPDSGVIHVRLGWASR